jgi:hypothetical protein
VTGVSVALGEAAGMAAALSLEGHTDPAHIDSKLLVASLKTYRDELTARWLQPRNSN